MQDTWKGQHCTGASCQKTQKSKERRQKAPHQPGRKHPRDPETQESGTMAPHQPGRKPWTMLLQQKQHSNALQGNGGSPRGAPTAAKSTQKRQERPACRWAKQINWAANKPPRPVQLILRTHMGILSVLTIIRITRSLVSPLCIWPLSVEMACFPRFVSGHI
jgi:hypothetical protein